MKEQIEIIREQLKNYIIQNNIKSLVLGVSGGIDSALCAVLAKPVCNELKIPLIGRSITLGNKTNEINRGDLIGKYFCNDFKNIWNLNSDFDNLWNCLKDEGYGVKDEKINFRKGNIKARLRMIYLYDLVQLHNGMVLSTDNTTEYLLGFWSLHGDVGDYGMIQGLWKTEVYDMSEWLVNNELIGNDAVALSSCINCQATDGLGISNTDLDQIMPGWKGSSRDGYKKVDEILKLKDSINIKADNPVIDRYNKTMFKRNNPYNIKRKTLKMKTI